MRRPLLAALFSTIVATPAWAIPLLPGSEPDWNCAPSEGPRDIRVAPLLVVGPMPALPLTGYVGETLERTDAAVRAARHAQVEALPGAVAQALPGEVGRVLPPEWAGGFRDEAISTRFQGLLAAAVEGVLSLDGVMRDVAQRTEGEAVLFSWVTDVEATPLATVSAPATTARAADRYVYVDRRTDPVLVELTVGLALVARDGEVFLRYEDRYQVVISEASNAARAGREVARNLVSELVPLLTPDARLAEW